MYGRLQNAPKGRLDNKTPGYRYGVRKLVWNTLLYTDVGLESFFELCFESTTVIGRPEGRRTT